MTGLGSSAPTSMIQQLFQAAGLSTLSTSDRVNGKTWECNYGQHSWDHPWNFFPYLVESFRDDKEESESHNNHFNDWLTHWWICACNRSNSASLLAGLSIDFDHVWHSFNGSKCHHCSGGFLTFFYDIVRVEWGAPPKTTTCRNRIDDFFAFNQSDIG